MEEKFIIVGNKTKDNKKYYLFVAGDYCYAFSTIKEEAKVFNSKEEVLHVYNKIKYNELMKYHAFMKSKKDIPNKVDIYIDSNNINSIDLCKTDLSIIEKGFEFINLESKTFNIKNRYDFSIVIKTDNSIEFIKSKNKNFFTLEELKNIVNGYIEVVTLPDNGIMIVNEEGAINGSKYNELATSILKYEFNTTSVSNIYGNVLICNSKLIR